MGQHDHEDLLCGILSIRGVAQHPQRQPVHVMLHGFEHVPRRRPVPGCGSPNAFREVYVDFGHAAWSPGRGVV